MKNIIIIGPPRSGKTTLAKMIIKNINNYSFMSLENFVTSYINAIQNNIKNKDSNNLKIDISIPKYQCYYYLLQSNYYENDLSYVVDFSDYDEKLFEELKKNSILIFLVYPNLNEDILYKNIKKHDIKTDWTYIESDEKLKYYCKYFIECSKEFEEYAIKNNCMCVDVSKNRDEVLLDTFNKIKEMINL